MNLVPRLRQACRRDRREAPTDAARAGQGPSAPAAGAHGGHSPMGGAASAPPGHFDPGEEVNRAVLSGVIVADPQRDRSREGDPVTVLLISFAAPDDQAHGGSACCEVEVPDELADPHRKDLRAGAPILVSGQMTGAGGIWADYIATGGAR